MIQLMDHSDMIIIGNSSFQFTISPLLMNHQSWTEELFATLISLFYSYDIYSEEAPKVTLSDIQEFSAIYDTPQGPGVDGYDDYESEVKCEFECVSHKNCVVSSKSQDWA